MEKRVKNCETCGKSYPRDKRYSDRQWELSRFCNKKCSAPWISKIKKGKPTPWMIGRKHSKEALEKNRLAHMGARSALYKDGRSAGANRKAYIALKALERYARLKGAQGTFTVEQWQGVKHKHDYKCVYCHKSESEVKLTKDHIVPLTRGGSNYINNIQPACQSCNSRKNNHLDYIWDGR